MMDFENFLPSSGGKPYTSTGEFSVNVSEEFKIVLDTKLCVKYLG